MKKLLLFFTLTFLSISCITANSMDISNTWLLTKVEIDGEWENVYQTFSFKPNGNVSLQDRVFGTWKIDNEKQIVKIDSKLIKEFSDNWNISKHTETELILKSPTATMNLVSYNPAQTATENKKSGLLGVWNFKIDDTEGGNTFLYFQEPNILSIKKIEPGVTSRTKGIWIYYKSTESVIMIINDYSLKGKSKVLSITDKKLVLEKDNNTITGYRLEQNALEREELPAIDDSSLETDNQDYNKDQLNYESCNWFNLEAKTSYLKNVTALKYRKSTLLDEFNVFTTSNISAGVSLDENRESIIIDKTFENLPAGEYSENNAFFPLEEPFFYSVSGEKEITVPAGTFKCKIIDTDDYSMDNRTRLYMIENRPGIYAKIINIQKQFDEETYTMYELTDIEGNFSYPNNKQILGKWLLTEMTSNGKKVKMSTNFEFISDGRLWLMQSENIDNFNWDYNTSENKVVLNFGHDDQNLNIKTLNTNKMVLENSNLRYNFIKMKPAATPLSREETLFKGYWMLTNSGNPYSLIYLSNDRSVYDIERIESFPIEGNYSNRRGNWMYDSTDKNLIFNTDKDYASVSGSINVKKINSNILILDDTGSELFFVKIDQENIKKNNSESELKGIWRIKDQNGGFNYYDFSDPFLFKKGKAEDDMPKTGLWLFNPKDKSLFLAYQMHQLEGFSVITKISENNIYFKNGLMAERVR